MVQTKTELGGKTHGPQHTHRVFTVALFGIADQADQSGLQIVQTAGVIQYREVFDIVIQGIYGEITALSVFLNGTIDIITADKMKLIYTKYRRGLNYFFNSLRPRHSHNNLAGIRWNRIFG